MNELHGRLDVLHDEMMASYSAAGDLLEAAQKSGSDAHVELFGEALKRAGKLSASYHAEADQVVMAWRSRSDGSS